MAYIAWELVSPRVQPINISKLLLADTSPYHAVHRQAVVYNGNVLTPDEKEAVRLYQHLLQVRSIDIDTACIHTFYQLPETAIVAKEGDISTRIDTTTPVLLVFDVDASHHDLFITDHCSDFDHVVTVDGQRLPRGVRTKLLPGTTLQAGGPLGSLRWTVMRDEHAHA
jgi:hypothetical protein